jgi:hypothetical protein
MFKTQETFDFLETFSWEEFKLWLNGRFTPHYLVLKNKIKLLEFNQGGSLATCV